MKKNNTIIKKLIVFLFVFYIAVPTALCGVLNLYGYYGEIKSSVILDSEDKFSDISTTKTVKKKVVSRTIYNSWLILLYTAVMIGISACVYRLPREDTIVYKKVRMNN